MFTAADAPQRTAATPAKKTLTQVSSCVMWMTPDAIKSRIDPASLFRRPARIKNITQFVPSEAFLCQECVRESFDPITVAH
jgi:hypothetical protein